MLSLKTLILLTITTSPLAAFASAIPVAATVHWDTGLAQAVARQVDTAHSETPVTQHRRGAAGVAAADDNLPGVGGLPDLGDLPGVGDLLGLGDLLGPDSGLPIDIPNIIPGVGSGSPVLGRRAIEAGAAFKA